jgi:DnaJ-class molecular chaperone
MADRKLYDLLGVKPEATDDEIRREYRKLAKKLHPDLNPGDKAAEARFKEVSAAYDILGDQDKRARYDRGEIDAEGQERPREGFYRRHADTAADHPYQSSAGFEDFADFSEIFGEAMRQRRSAGRRQPPADHPGSDVVYNMDVDFLDAALGVKRRVTMPDGVVLDISIPAGIEEGQVLRLKGKGMPGIGKGAPGDALILVAIRPHPTFRREGANVLLEVPVGIHEAVLGARIEVPTLDGSVRLALPKGAQNGQVLRLRGKGIATAGGAGDLLVTLRIAMPPAVDEELRAFFERWQTDHAYDPRKGGTRP